MTQQPLSVTEVTQYIKLLMDRDDVLSAVTVRGELSNYKMHSSGHHYFTLKDDGAVISCVMFRGDASRLRFRPESGMKVILSGRVSLFPKSGQYQIYVSDMQPDGIGALYVAFEQLKQKLQAEGLFDPAHKKALPTYPRRIALLTSPTGAAVRDMIRVLRHRFPLAGVLVCPVTVQGEGAAQEIASMLDYVNTYRLADLIITGRGGGSIEDLWAFNEEVTARAIYRSDIPVISAVGHEPDITIADFVADLRAATPSNGAELSVPDGTELSARLRGVFSHLAQMQLRQMQQKRQQLDAVRKKKVLSSPYGYLNERRMLLSLLTQRLESATRRQTDDKRRRYAATAARLDALSPLKVLSRGYSMISDGETVIKSAKGLRLGQSLRVTFSDGSADCAVQGVQIKESV